LQSLTDKVINTTKVSCLLTRGEVLLRVATLRHRLSETYRDARDYCHHHHRQQTRTYNTIKYRKYTHKRTLMIHISKITLNLWFVA